MMKGEPAMGTDKLAAQAEWLGEMASPTVKHVQRMQETLRMCAASLRRLADAETRASEALIEERDRARHHRDLIELNVLAFRALISKALTEAGVPEWHPDIGAPIRKPMTPQERISWLARSPSAQPAAGEPERIVNDIAELGVRDGDDWEPWGAAHRQPVTDAEQVGEAYDLRPDCPTHGWNHPCPHCERQQAAPRPVETGGDELGVHELKTWVGPFEAVLDGTKRFEWRRYDRRFREGDTLRLREWDEAYGKYTGRESVQRVTYIASGRFGIPADYCIMSIEPLASRPSTVEDGAERERAADKVFERLAWALTMTRQAVRHPFEATYAAVEAEAHRLLREEISALARSPSAQPAAGEPSWPAPPLPRTDVEWAIAVVEEIEFRIANDSRPDIDLPPNRQFQMDWRLVSTDCLQRWVNLLRPALARRSPAPEEPEPGPVGL